MIGAAVNLAATLVTFNKTLTTRGLATREAYDLARRQGWRRRTSRRSSNATVPGVEGPIDIVVLARPGGTAAGKTAA